MKMRIVFLLLMATALITGPALAGVTVIANPSVLTDSISKNDLKEIFLGKQVKWPDNSRIKFVLSGDYDIHITFLKQYVGRSPTQFEMYWRNQVFTGQGQTPVKLRSDRDIINFVASTPGAVGYVSSQPESSAIKKLTVN